MKNKSLSHLSPEEKIIHKKKVKAEWSKNNKHKIKIYRKKYKSKFNYKALPKDVKIKLNKYKNKLYHENKDKVNERRRELYKIKMQNEEFRKHNAEKNKKWKKNNPEKTKISSTKSDKKGLQRRYVRVKIRRKTDVLFRLKETLHARMREHFKSKTDRGGKSKEEVLGATKHFVKLYLERQFKKGMTWENYGHKGWHIDHKIPLASAKTKEELIALFHYTNLQPLWAKENFAKSDKILPIQVKLHI